MNRPRAFVIPLQLIGVAAFAAGVLLHQSYPTTGAILMVIGVTSISVFLLFTVFYDWTRRRQATRLLSKRTQRSSREFAATFFPESPELAAKLRDSLADYLRLDLGGLLPDDDLNAICDAQTDDPSLIWHLEQEFGLGETFSEYTEFTQIEEATHTFRGLLEFVENRSKSAALLKGNSHED